MFVYKCEINKIVGTLKLNGNFKFFFDFSKIFETLLFLKKNFIFNNVYRTPELKYYLYENMFYKKMMAMKIRTFRSEKS